MLFSSSQQSAFPPEPATCSADHSRLSNQTCDTTPTSYARTLLDSLGATAIQPLIQDQRSAASLWADSGAMWLSGHVDGPPHPCPAPLAACAQGVWLALASLNPDKLDPLFSAHQLLGERAAIAGLSRQGRTSAGGACRLLPTGDGYLALNLAREDDWELMPAWLEQAVDSEQELLKILTTYSTELLVERGRLLGLAIAPVAAPSPTTNWYRWTRYAPPRLPSSKAPVVVDLTSLWAGPLCGSLLAQLGARVIKVESTQRPDGARFGPAPFYQLMNAGKESVALDLSSVEGRAQLRSLLSHADIVLEAARPRALEQMGIVAADLVSECPGMTWLSITGYGRREPMREWIAYGDDAGVAAGLSWLMSVGNSDPVFCGDAIADPLTGLHAALLAQTAWQQGGGLLMDLPLCDVVSHCINAGASSVTDKVNVTKPQARTLSQAVQPLGQDTARIVQEFL